MPELSDATFEQRWQFMLTEAVAGQWVRARVLHGNQLVDTVGMFFMTPDRQNEAWSITTAIKEFVRPMPSSQIPPPP